MWRCKSSRNLCIQLITRNVIILVMFLIFSIAYAFLGSEKAFEHFSFASTVTSIILSLLAIILTLDSEAKNEAVKGMVDKSLVHMNENTKKLERYGEKFDDIKPLLEKILSYATDTNTRVKTEQFNAAVNSNLVFEYKREDADCGK